MLLEDAPLDISCYLSLHKLLTVNSKDQTFTIAATVEFKWHDENVAADVRGSGIERIVSAEKIWTPDIAILNSQVYLTAIPRGSMDHELGPT